MYSTTKCGITCWKPYVSNAHYFQQRHAMRFVCHRHIDIEVIKGLQPVTSPVYRQPFCVCVGGGGGGGAGEGGGQ